MNSRIRKAFYFFISIVVICVALIFSADSYAKTGIVNTKHNLSVTGPGTLKSLSETRICVFCHTPHNAAPRTPLWNKELTPVNYILYKSSTLSAVPSQPSGPSRLCLSCHDGTIALGAVLRPVEGIRMTGEITMDRPSYLGTNLSDDHPFAFSYYDSLPNSELAPVPPSDLIFYGGSNIHCSTCHDPHDDTYGKFLVKDNTYSALCTSCHIKDGWPVTPHSYSLSTWNGGLPDPWPKTLWTTVAENGCENCHTPHSAKGSERLLNCFDENCISFNEEGNCYPCHNGNVAQKNIKAQFQKSSRHSLEYATGLHNPKESQQLITTHVECVDCHNPHSANNRAASAPYASGRLEKISGVTAAGVIVTPATYEYEVCFKCHADSTPDKPFTIGFPIPRVANTVNTRAEFDVNNPSYHPVIGDNPNTSAIDLPSIPSPYMPTLTASSYIYCMDCHESDESSAIGGTGPRGTHGSMYAPILRERYETNDNTTEGYAAYALCYRCHNRTSILNDDSFKKNLVAAKGGHSGHLGSVVNAPCSACHDPHGVRLDPLSGDHTHLINFDTRIVTPLTGNTYPTFTDRGTFTGSCSLVCHGKTHDNMSYP